MADTHTPATRRPPAAASAVTAEKASARTAPPGLVGVVREWSGASEITRCGHARPCHDLSVGVDRDRLHRRGADVDTDGHLAGAAHRGEPDTAVTGRPLWTT